MKILFIITQSEMGGAQRFLLEFAPYLVSKNYEVVVAAGEGDGELFEQFSNFPIFQFSNNFQTPIIKTYKIAALIRKLNPAKDLLALISIIKIIKKEKPDVLFLQSTKAGFLGSLAAKLTTFDLKGFNPFKPEGVKPLQALQVKIICIIYRIGGWSFRDPRPWWMNQILFWMEKISAPWKDTIIVNSEFDRRLAIKKGIVSEDQIVKIYNGIEPNSIKFLPREEARSKLESRMMNHESSNEILIGAIANLYATKGIEHLVEAARILNSKFMIRFVVIGEGKERQKLESLIKKYNLKNSFFLVGNIKDARKYLKAFDIFVLSSLKEGFPWAVLEAMAAEVPVIATSVGAVPEIIEDGKNGLLVNPSNAGQLAEKIKLLAENQKMRAKLSEKAYFSLHNFSSKKMLEQSEEIIKKTPPPLKNGGAQ